MSSQALLSAFLLNPMLAAAFPLTGLFSRAFPLPPPAKSYTLHVWDDAKGTWKTKSYPVLTQSTCPTEGPDVGKGICEDSCMAPYMNPKTLYLTFEAEDGTQLNSTLNWTLPHWGDRDGLHVPLQSLLAEYEKGNNSPDIDSFITARRAPANLGTLTITPSPALERSYDTVQPTRTFGTVQPTKTDVMNASPAFKLTPTPTAGSDLYKLVPCRPLAGDNQHTPVITAPLRLPYDTSRGIATLTPLNPVCDEDDPIGWTDEEKLWLHQNKKPSFWSRTSANEDHIECYNYESCWDHCQEVHRRDMITRWAVLGLFMLMMVLILLSCLVCGCQKFRSKREIKGKQENREVTARANKKRVHEPLPVILESPQQFDGPADGEHSVVTTGRESLCSDEGVAKRV